MNELRFSERIKKLLKKERKKERKKEKRKKELRFSERRKNFRRKKKKMKDISICCHNLTFSFCSHLDRFLKGAFISALSIFTSFDVHVFYYYTNTRLSCSAVFLSL